MARKPKTADTAAASTTTELTVPPFGKDGQGRSIIARVCWIHVESTAKLGGLDIIGIHEVPLMRKKLLHDGEVRLIGEWPPNTPRFRDMNAPMLGEAYQRMRDRYAWEDPNAAPGTNPVVDLTVDLYGPPAQSRLVPVLRRIEVAFRKLLAAKGEEFPTPQELEEIVALTSQDEDFEQDDGIPYTPAAAGKA